MHLIASPYFNEDDASQIQLGYDARSAGATKAMLRVLEDLGSFDEASVERQRVACLAWSIAQGRLSLKLAFRTTRGNEGGVFG